MYNDNLNQQDYYICQLMKSAEKEFIGPIPEEYKLAILGDLASQAIAEDNLEDLEVFLRYGADVNVCMEWGYKGQGGYLLDLAVEKGNEKIIKILLDHKADPEKSVIQAVAYGYIEGLKALLKYVENAANVYVYDEDECEYKGSVLGLARKKGNEEIIKLLLEHNASEEE